MKMVLIQNECEGSYSFWSHNLDQEDATRESQELQGRKVSVLTLDQAGLHEVEDAEMCGECQRELDRFLAQSQGGFHAQTPDSFEG